MNWYKFAKEKDEKPYKLVKRVVEDFGPPFEVEEARTLNDLYIGEPRYAAMLFREHCFDPYSFEAIDEGGEVAAIAYDTELKEWFGWSHRGMKGFGVGDRADTLEKAKELARKFAENMS